MKQSILLLFLFTSVVCYCQTITVRDSVSKQAIPFTTVAFYKESKQVAGNYASTQGEVNLAGRDFDSITVSCIGYETKTVNKEVLTDVLYLQELPEKLEEVIITRKPVVEIGYVNNKRLKTKMHGSAKFVQMAALVENVFKQPVTISSISFKVVKVTGHPAYRLHLYTVDKEKNVPAEDLLTQDIIKHLNPNEKGLVEIDLKELNVKMPLEGLFVTLEGLGCYEESGLNEECGFTFEMFQTRKPTFCYKYLFYPGGGPTDWVNDNQRLANDEKHGDFKLTKKSFMAPSFGLKVEQP